MSVRIAAVAVASLAFASASPFLTTRQSCSATSPYIICARGSDEDPGVGVVGTVAQSVQAAIPSAQIVAVDYPASIFDPPYPDSVSDGISATITLIQNYVNECGANSNIILLGFSQGGNVVTDVLAGGVDKPDPITSDYAQYSRC